MLDFDKLDQFSIMIKFPDSVVESVVPDSKLKKIFTNMDFFSYLEKRNFSLLIPPKKRKQDIIDLSFDFIKGLISSYPLIIFQNKEKGLHIFVASGEIKIVKSLESGKNDEDEDKFLKVLSTDLRNLISLVYSEEMFDEKPVEVPSEIHCKYRLDKETVSNIYSKIIEPIECSKKLGKCSLQSVRIKFETSINSWLELGLDSDDDSDKIIIESLLADNLSLNEMSVRKLIKSNISQTNFTFSELME